jgi:hypothetical protein
MKLSIASLSLMALSIVTFSVTKLSTKTLSMIALSIVTFSEQNSALRHTA